MKKHIAFSGALAVALGALGAHALKEVLEPSSLESYQVAVFYHLVHTLAILAVVQGNYIKLTVWLWTSGILLFSGSIYLLAVDELLGINLSFIGPITPIGGLLFIAGWCSLIFSSNTNVDK
ncbi:MAG TPA: DUF423 domain-containing protein [Cryomorphaceae bacterium]|nr:DUF423 domain-containing protein [Cryomorphaceae bacterium]|tara:strand:- start:76 stop:438 length:363 start_codon:yes stop_codon:yes gene_type:complete